MKLSFFKLLSAVLLMSFGLCAMAADSGTRDEAVAMVKKAVAYAKQNGKDKAMAEFSNPRGQFIDRDLYIAALDLTGLMLASGVNPKLIGKNLFDIKDMSGKYFVREEIDLAKSKGSGWVDFEWMNPVSQKMEHRSAYLERIDDYIILSGVYKK
jgi:cytochrome c